MDENLEARVSRERAWHDIRFSDDTRVASTSRFYKALETWYKDYRKACKEVEFKCALEIGAGLESLTAYPEFAGRNITAIDISKVVIEKMSNEFKAKSFEFIVADAHNMKFENSSFDLIFARGVLHHLDLNVAIPELKRVLRFNGNIIFAEPLSGNVLIRFYRYITPHLRTPDERPLSRRDIKIILKSFPSVRIKYYGFLTLIPAVLTGRTFLSIEKLDSFILNTLRLGPLLAWSCIISDCTN